jgi:hypothetical protein
MNIANILIGPILSIIDKAVPDKTAAAKMKGEIEQIVLQNEAAMLEAASAVAMADAKSEGWMTRNARPLTVINMLVIANVIVVAGVINPDYAARVAEALSAVPGALWGLIGGGIGLYQFMRPVSQMLGKGK